MIQSSLLLILGIESYSLPHLVLHGTLVQCVQLSVQLVHLVGDVIHLLTQALVASQVRVKLSLVLPALQVRGQLRVPPGGAELTWRHGTIIG